MCLQGGWYLVLKGLILGNGHQSARSSLLHHSSLNQGIHPNIRFWPDFKPSSTNLGSSFDLFILVPFPCVSFNKNQVKISLNCLFHSEAKVLANLLPLTASIQSNLGGWWGVCYYWNMSSSVQSSKSWLTISLIHLQCTRTKKQLTNRNNLKVSLSRMGTEAIRLDK